MSKQQQVKQGAGAMSQEDLAKLAEDVPKAARAPFEDVVYPRPKGGPCAAGFIVEGEMVTCALELGHDGEHVTGRKGGA